MIRIKHISLAVVAFLCVLSAAHGQPGDPDFDETQVVTGNRELSVASAYKISELPNVVPSDIRLPNITYTLIPRKIDVEPRIDTIAAARLATRDALTKLYRNYLRAGIGTYLTPQLEFNHSSLRSRDWLYNVNVKHLSSNKGIKNRGYSGFSENAVALSARRLLNQVAIDGGISYNRDVVHYYGFDPLDLDIDRDDYRQRFSRFGIRAGVESFYRDSTDLNYKLSLQYSNLSDLFGTAENNFVLNGAFRKQVDDFYARAGLVLDINGYQTDAPEQLSWIADTALVLPGIDRSLLEQSSGIFGITPTLVKQGERYTVTAGLGLFGYFQNQAKFYAWPIVEASYSFFDHLIVPYVRIGGQVQRNSFETLTATNPFLLNYQQLRPTRDRINLAAGVKGEFSSEVTFNVGVSHRSVADLVLFVNDTLYSDENRFDVIYDDAGVTSFHGALDIKTGKLDAQVAATLFNYNMDSEAEAWHLAPWRGDLRLGYNMQDKLLVGVSMAVEGPRKVKSLRPVPDEAPANELFTVVELKTFADAGLFLEYRYNRRLSLFAEGTNLFATQYDRWYQFPVQRTLVSGGFTYIF